MKCSVCGNKIKLINSYDEDLELELELMKQEFYTVKKSRGSGYFCENCGKAFAKMVIRKNFKGAKEFYDSMVQRNMFHENFDVKALGEYIDYHTGAHKFLPEPEVMTEMLNTIVLRRKQELERLFGGVWVSSDTDYRVAGQIQNGNIVLARNFHPSTALKGTIEASMKYYDNLENYSIERLFGISYFAIDSIVDYSTNELSVGAGDERKTLITIKNEIGIAEKKEFPLAYFDVLVRLIPEKSVDSFYGSNSQIEEEEEEWYATEIEDVPEYEAEDEIENDNTSDHRDVVLSEGMVEEMKRLKTLFDLGLIDQDDFNAKKKEILGL